MRGDLHAPHSDGALFRPSWSTCRHAMNPGIGSCIAELRSSSNDLMASRPMKALPRSAAAAAGRRILNRAGRFQVPHDLRFMPLTMPPRGAWHPLAAAPTGCRVVPSTGCDAGVRPDDRCTRRGPRWATSPARDLVRPFAASGSCEVFATTALGAAARTFASGAVGVIRAALLQSSLPSS